MTNKLLYYIKLYCHIFAKNGDIIVILIADCLSINSID